MRGGGITEKGEGHNKLPVDVALFVSMSAVIMLISLQR